MIYPTKRTVLLVTMGVPPTLLGVIAIPYVWPLGVAWFAAVVVLASLDALLGCSIRRSAITWQTPSILYIGERDPMIVQLPAGTVRHAAKLELLVDVAGVLRQGDSQTFRIDSGRDMRLRLPLVATRRGIAGLAHLWLRWSGPFGLIERVVKYPLGTEIPVLPNLRAVRQSALFIHARQAFYGSKVQRERGSGSEFDALRDHVPGLDHRAIDWKHSARHCKLVSKEFQAERNHQLLVAIDCGHLMGEPLDGIAKLDHAINAGLVLSYAALHAGDRVGVFGFDSEVRLHAAPNGGLRSFPRVQEAFSKLDYHDTETNFTLGLTELLTRLTQRSLVVVVSDFVDTITAEIMVENLGRLAVRHVILFVTLRDPVLAHGVERRPDNLESLAQAVIVNDLARERARVLERLRRLGVLCVDTDVGHLNTDLVNRYLSVKARELV